MKASQLENLLQNNQKAPVLFISDEVNGDQFWFGTWVELQTEKEARENSEVYTAQELLVTFDFKIYEDQDITVRL